MVKICIKFDTNKRKNTVSSSRKYFFKLMNNSVCGKSMENLRKRVKARLIKNADYNKYISKSSFVS